MRTVCRYTVLDDICPSAVSCRGHGPTQSTSFRFQPTSHERAPGRPEIDLNNDRRGETNAPIPTNHLRPGVAKHSHETCLPLHHQPVVLRNE